MPIRSGNSPKMDDRVATGHRPCYLSNVPEVHRTVPGAPVVGGRLAVGADHLVPASTRARTTHRPNLPLDPVTRVLKAGSRSRRVAGALGGLYVLAPFPKVLANPSPQIEQAVALRSGVGLSTHGTIFSHRWSWPRKRVRRSERAASCPSGAALGHASGISRTFQTVFLTACSEVGQDA